MWNEAVRVYLQTGHNNLNDYLGLIDLHPYATNANFKELWTTSKNVLNPSPKSTIQPAKDYSHVEFIPTSLVSCDAAA